MTDVYAFAEGRLPLLVSIPHDGRNIENAMAAKMSPEGLALPDTDWHVQRLYDFVSELGASVIAANYSRYVVDLNRAATDDSLYEGQVATGLCPDKTFAGENIYLDGSEVANAEKARRIHAYWQPYHDKLSAAIAAMHEQFGYALVWDAHSIPSRVPRLFGGELPVLNIGTFDDHSCSPSVSARVVQIANASSYETAINARFKGGFITRHYGDPGSAVHAIQLEIAQRAYMDERSGGFDETKAVLLRATLRAMLDAFLKSAKTCQS